MKIVKLFFVLFVFMLFFNTDAEGQSHEVTTFEKITTPERQAIKIPFLREADVSWRKRIHRIIDTREKQNMVMNWPKNPFYQIIYDVVTVGRNEITLTAYKNDSLIGYYTRDDILKRGATEEVIQIPYDPEYPDDTYDSTVFNELRPSDISRYKIIEDWIFDKQRGEIYPRIIAIAPLFNMVVEGVDLGEEPLFWVKYDKLRGILINENFINRHNDGMRTTFSDFFELRLFNSYIIKENNVFDNAIREFEEFKDNPFAALLQSERIKKELFNWEADLWQY